MIVSLSGGLDSTTLLALAVNNGWAVRPVAFVYGSQHNALEITAARRICEHYGLKLQVLSLHNVFSQVKSGLLQGGGKIPEGHYESETMKATVVPGRNLIFASVLASICESEGGGLVGLGVHQGDHAIYPDCRPRFIASLRATIMESTEDKVHLFTPFLEADKAHIVKLGLSIKAPYHLTRTCYTGGDVACGKCGSCNERREAFNANGVEDPIEYAYRGPLPEKPT